MKTSQCMVLFFAAACALGSAGKLKVKRDADVPDSVWLANHLKEEFELDKNGRLKDQSGLNIAWNHKETRPRNAKHDCEDGPGALSSAYQKEMDAAEKRGKLAAARLSNQR